MSALAIGNVVLGQERISGARYRLAALEGVAFFPALV
jgi:hypothetical protein